MTTERILERVMRITEAVKADACVVALMDCNKLIEDLKTELSMKAAKQSGNNDIFAAAMKILKCGAKASSDLSKAITAKDGSLIIMDGCRAIKFSAPMSLPRFEDKENFRAENFANNISNLINELSKKPGQKITPPAIDELKNFIAIETAAKKARGEKCKSIDYELTPGLKVEARLFVEMLRALPNAVIFVSDNAMGQNKIIYLKAENGNGIILPLLKKDD